MPFGYSPIIEHTTAPPINPDLYVAYPQLASELFRPRKKVFNASCPGETSSSLISVTSQSNGCESSIDPVPGPGYRTYNPLHVAYSGSQLAYAQSYVAANPRTGLVTMMIGANDLFLLIDSCGGSTTPAQVACIEAGLPVLLGTLQTNLTTIYSALRAAGFAGEFLAVTYYSLNYVSDPVGTLVIGLINGTLAGVTQSFGGKVADGFGAFEAAAGPAGYSCAAGLLIHLTATACDVHPSPAGAALLAQAVRAAA